MRNNINIVGNNQSFPYLIEYSKGKIKTDGYDVNWCYEDNTIHLIKGDIKHYRNKNNWYNVSNLSLSHDNIPYELYTSTVTVYIPVHSVSAYVKNIKYALTLNTWINGIKIDLGTYIFSPNDTVAISKGAIRNGNNEYFECISFDIIDPFNLIYGDNWINFRNIICREPLQINSTGSSMQASLFIVDEGQDDDYIMKADWVGGMTNAIISDHSDFLQLNISTNLDPLGIKFDISMNDEYNWFLTYLYETYDINVSQSNIKFDLMIKNADSIIIGPRCGYACVETYGHAIQTVMWKNIDNNNGVKLFFDDWDAFEEGWSFVGSLVVLDGDEEIFTIVSNELPITQETFSMFTNGGSEKIIDIDDMNVIQYNVVNKIENNIVQIDRPNESKSNIMQPVFFRSKDAELLTLHPAVTENISINLDDYKAKVDKFTLQIEGCKYEQIGVNKYGILFKITANTLPSSASSGVYYILDENLELVTTGKYNCVR